MILINQIIGFLLRTLKKFRFLRFDYITFRHARVDVDVPFEITLQFRFFSQNSLLRISYQQQSAYKINVSPNSSILNFLMVRLVAN